MNSGAFSNLAGQASDSASLSDLCWARSERFFCVFGYLGAGIAERRTPGHQSKRYFARGVDESGRAGNQLVVQRYGGQVCAIRGQMPVLFRQRPNLRPAPKPSICPDQAAQDAAFRRFLERQRAFTHGAPLLLLNLIDMRGW